MAAIVISNSAPFGAMTNQMISRLVSLNSTIPRLDEAATTASAGYEGVPGTQFETSVGLNGGMPNNFGVAPDPANPGQKGSDYRYAVDTLAQAWATFWTAAQGSIEQLDNGLGPV